MVHDGRLEPEVLVGDFAQDIGLPFLQRRIGFGEVQRTEQRCRSHGSLPFGGGKARVRLLLEDRGQDRSRTVFQFQHVSPVVEADVDVGGGVLVETADGEKGRAGLVGQLEQTLGLIVGGDERGINRGDTARPLTGGCWAWNKADGLRGVGLQRPPATPSRAKPVPFWGRLKQFKPARKSIHETIPCRFHSARLSAPAFIPSKTPTCWAGGSIRAS